MAVAILASSQVVYAACAPNAPAPNNSTVNCTGATANQNGTAGYGAGTEANVTVNVTASGPAATVAGTNIGINLGTGGDFVTTGLNNSVNVGNGNTVTGSGSYGIYIGGGTATIVNSGTIQTLGIFDPGIFGNQTLNLTNNATGVISTPSNSARDIVFAGTLNVSNAGMITGSTTSPAYALHGNGALTLTSNTGTISAFNGVVSGGTLSGNNANIISASTVNGTAVGAGGKITSFTNSGMITGFFGISSAVGGTSLADLGSSITNSGTINSAGGGFAIQLADNYNTVTLYGTSSITGSVRGGTTAANNTLVLGGSTAGTFDVSAIDTGTFTLQYRAFSLLNKSGSSTWTLTGTSASTIPINITGGTLAVNGNTSSSSQTTVGPGGTLGGTGTVGVTTINGGTLAPGNSIGTLTVQGNLTFTAAGTYMIEFSPANADRTNVIGTATLGGATVNAIFAAGSYVNKQYTILNATVARVGTFNALVNTNLPGGFTSSLSYDANNAYLNLTLVPGGGGGGVGGGGGGGGSPGSTPPLTTNQQAVANALVNFFNTNGGIPLVFGTLSPAGLTQASGETATGSQQTSFNAMTQFLGVITDPFIAGRGDGFGGGTGPTGFADEEALAYAAKRKPGDAMAAIYAKAPRPMPFQPSWSTWAAGFGGSQKTDGNAFAGSNDTRSSIYGIAAGADYRFSPNTIAGFALAGGGTGFSVNGFGSGRSDLFQAGAFVRHNVGPAYITAAAAYGWQDVTTNRTVTIAGVDQLRARFDANAYSGRIEGGYRFVSPLFGGFGLTPYAAGQATTFDLPSYAETAVLGANTFALAFGSRNVTATRGELGVRTDKSYATETGLLTLRGRTAWAHDDNPNRSVSATFQTLPGASFTVNGARQARDALLSSSAIEFKWLNNWSVAANFESEWSNVTSSYAGKGVVRYVW